jgi:outer membrane receptor protein involved in Fe transport
MLSLGNWEWKSDVSADIFDDGGVFVDNVTVNADGLKVNDAAQTTYAFGLNYKVLDRTSIFLDYNYAGDIYAKVDFSEGTTDRLNTWKLPSYHLFDLGFNHGFTIGEFDATLSGNMNNLFDIEYVSDAFDASDHSATAADVYYGAGRTFSLGLTVNF